MKTITRVQIVIGLCVSCIVGYCQEPSGEAVSPPTGVEAAPPAAQRGEVLPLIQYDEVALTTVIESLARQAGINYILDYKVPYGQIGPDGKPMPQPIVTIRWENITAEAALLAVLNNYDLQLVEDPRTKVARITRKDPAAPDPLVTKIIQLKYASASNMAVAVQSVLTDKRSKVLPDTRTSQLIVVATEREQFAVQELIDKLDTQTRQVLIEGRIMEVSLNPKTKKGIDWSRTLNEQRFSFGNGVMSGTTKTTIPGSGGARYDESTELTTIMGLGIGGLSLNTYKGFTPNIGFLDADGVNAVLSFLNTYAESRVLSAPRTVTLDNEPTFIEVGQMYPVVNVTPSSQMYAGGSQISYTNLTLRLEVTPSISANDYVNLKVKPSVLRLGPKISSKVAGQDNIVDSFYKRDMETRVLIPSGNTLVLGGLVQDEIQDAATKVPVLGDIPLLGYAFRSKSRDRSKMNLLIFLTPTIIRDEDFQPTTTEFLKTPLPPSDSLEGDWSPWDTTEPVDWSQPEPLKAAKKKPKFDESLVAPKAR
ncbi:MAG: hypothetical protein NZ739_07195 [Verrucomicrobiae bacterium]|nr:hypothetical protein [Verrucomicrobiae bacterium]MDW7979856.1 secretin N-terminal domain-containing protein [Verrucomicrobiales bacterium]